MLTRFRNLNLRFIEGDGGEVTGGGDSALGDQSQVAPEQGAPTQQSQGNPAWEPVRSALDPISFSKIEPHLKDMDKSAQSRIESLTKQYEPFQAHLKDRQPEFVGKAIAYAEALERDPAQVYQMLGDFLQQTGRFPTQKEAEQEFDAQDAEEQQEPVKDPRVDQIMEHLARIERQEASQRATSELQTAVSSLQEAHKDLTPEDTQEIIRRAAFVAQQNPGKDINFSKELESAYADFAELKNRILSTPRPGDSAPLLPPISGGTPAAPHQQQKPWSQYSNQEIQNLIAGGLVQNRG